MTIPQLPSALLFSRPPLGTLDAFSADLCLRLRSGSHFILFGPRGSGKSTLLLAMQNQFRSMDVPCGLAPCTTGLPDIVDALAQAYPGTDIAKIGRRAAGARLRNAADKNSGVLLLDHATSMTTTMLGYLRRLRGGVVGVLLVSDIDSPKERERMRAWHAGTLSIRMPLESNQHLKECLSHGIRSSGRADIAPQSLRKLVLAARGRIGWAAECGRRLSMQDYWTDDRLHVAALCTDVELALRTARLGPRVLFRRRRS